MHKSFPFLLALALLGCRQQESNLTFLTPRVHLTDEQGNTTVHAVKPRGEYASIDVADSNKALAILLSDTLRPDYKASIARQIAHMPGDHHPGALLALGVFLLKKKDYEKGAFFVQAALLRSYVDVRMSQDTSLDDMHKVMLAQIRKHVPNLDAERFEKCCHQVVEDVIAWDRATPRGYDRRWASLRSSGVEEQAPMHYLPLAQQQQFIDEVYRLMRQCASS